MRRKLASLAAAAVVAASSLLTAPASDAYTTPDGVYAINDYASPYSIGMAQSYVSTVVVVAPGHWNWEYQGPDIDPTITRLWLGPFSCVAVWRMVGGAWVKSRSKSNWTSTGLWVAASNVGMTRGLNRIWAAPSTLNQDPCLPKQ